MRSALLIIALALALTQSVRAQTALPNARIAPSDPTRIAETNAVDWATHIDRKHAAIGSYIIGFGEGMDAWLATSFRDPAPQPNKGRMDRFVSDKRLEDDSPSSRLKVTPYLKLRDANGLKPGIHVNGKLRLPRFEDRLAIIFSSVDENEALLDDLQRESGPRNDADRQGTASLRYYIKETLNFNASVDAGLRFRPEPDPRLSLRLRVHHDYKYVTTRLTQSFFWEAHDGFGEKTQFDLDQQKSRDYLRRLSTTVVWGEASDGVEAGQSLSFYKYLSERRVIGVRLGVAGTLEPSLAMESYTARLIYRKRIHRHWMFLEFEPGVEFPRDRDFQSTAFFNVKLDIIFGDWNDRKP